MENNFDILKDLDDVLTFKEFKQVLKISKSKAYRLLKNNIIPSRKLGSEYRILKRDIIEFLQS